MKGTLEKLRRMFSGRKPSDHHQDDVTLSRFARSTSFKRTSMRRSQRRPARKRAVVTNRGIYYVEDATGDGVGGGGGGSGGGRVDGAGTNVNGRTSSPTTSPRSSGVGKDEGNDTLDSQSTTHSQGTISYTDWIQISDDDTLDRPGSGVGERKSSASRNFSLEGKSVPFDSPLPGSDGSGGGRRKTTQAETGSKQRRSCDDKSNNSTNNLSTSATDDPPAIVSTFGSSCTSGVHSMEKSMLDVAGGGGARRRQPTVVATRDQLRRSLRRISGRRAKKAARRLADGGSADVTPASVMDDAFYRRFAKLPLVLTNDDGSSPSPGATATDGDKSSTPRTPFAFSRQNPITRWLEESEKLHRRSTATSDTERLLWSELVTAPPSEDRARRAAKAAKRAARSRTPTRKSLRRKLKSSRPRVDAPLASAGAVVSASPTCAVASASAETASAMAAVGGKAAVRSEVVIVSVV